MVPPPLKGLKEVIKLLDYLYLYKPNLCFIVSFQDFEVLKKSQSGSALYKKQRKCKLTVKKMWYNKNIRKTNSYIQINF